MKRPEQPTKVNETDYRGKTAPALVTADVCSAVLPPPSPPTVSDIFPTLAFDRLSLLLRLPGHREHIRRESLKPVTYRSGRVTLVHLSARSSESLRGTTNFIFLFDK